MLAIRMCIAGADQSEALNHCLISHHFSLLKVHVEALLIRHSRLSIMAANAMVCTHRVEGRLRCGIGSLFSDGENRKFSPSEKSG